MIILDTNVVSEIMKDAPDPKVLDWFERHESNRMWLTAISLAELLYGINRLPVGRRCRLLDEKLALVLEETFPDRCLNFDRTAAQAYGRIVQMRFESGRPISISDAQIAAIALAYDATLATRNVKDFDGTGVKLVNPWADERGV